MLEENKLSWFAGEVSKGFTDKKYVWKCPICGVQYEVSRDTIDDITTSDVHNPSEDVLCCNACGYSVGLYKSVKMEDGSEIFSDGYYIYVTDAEEGKVYRLA